PRAAPGDRAAGTVTQAGALVAPGRAGRTDRARVARRQGTGRHACCLAAPRRQLRGQSAGPQDRGAGGLRPLRRKSRSLPRGRGIGLQWGPAGAAPTGGASVYAGVPAAHVAGRAARVDGASHSGTGPASPGPARATARAAGTALAALAPGTRAAG